MLNSQNLVVCLKNVESTSPKLDNNILGVITQSFIFFRYALTFPRYQNFCQYFCNNVRMKSGQLLECVELYEYLAINLKCSKIKRECINIKSIGKISGGA